MQKNELDREEYISRLQQLINKNQKYLRLIGVSHPSLERVIQLASERNLFAKLTGAGGGGCAFVLLDEDENKTVQFRNMLSNEGFKCYMSNVGHEGVLINLIP
jgi:mevalonate kinase